MSDVFFRNLPRTTFLFFLVLFSVSIFKNIAYPLLWQDESETTFAAKRIIEYGYPKSSDGKNTLNLLELPDKNLAIKEPYDAYITSAWGQFYVATIGVRLSEFATDIYDKTALIRIPFALIGLVGILLCAQVTKSIFHGRSKWIFLSCYLLLCMLSISLTLHLREVRYYSLTILLSGTMLWLYTMFTNNRTTLSKRSFVMYTFMLIVLLNVTLLTFPPLFFILILTLGISEAWHLYSLTPTSLIRKDYMYHILPIGLALCVSVPIFMFFEIIPTASAISAYFGFGFTTYVFNIVHALRYLLIYEFLALMLLCKGAQLIIQRVTSKSNQPPQHIAILKLSNFLFLYLIMYLLFIARTPYLFERYLMALIPFLNLMLILDLFYTAHALRTMASKKLRSDLLFVTIPVFLFVMIISLVPKLPHITGHIYELTHQYKGPLDYAIPYIQNTFSSLEELTIATNYEELSYAFYLGSKVTIGYVGNNLAEDSTIQPDIIIMRNNRNNFVDTFQLLLSKDTYSAVNLEIDDYDFNNIPELDLVKPHRYQTTFAKDENSQLKIYVRTEILQNPVSR